MSFLRTTFSEGVPEELGVQANNAIITENIVAVSNEQGSISSQGILKEGFAVGATLAAILVPAEIINSKLPD